MINGILFQLILGGALRRRTVGESQSSARNFPPAIEAPQLGIMSANLTVTPTFQCGLSMNRMLIDESQLCS